MSKDEIYSLLISIAEEKSTILEKVEYDPELARENSRYRELEQMERGFLLQIKQIEDSEIIENSFLFAYDSGIEKERTMKVVKMDYKQIIAKWKSKNIKTIEDLKQSLSSYKIIFAYNSGVIENPEITYHNTREIFENGKVVNFSGDLRTLYEIENQKKCFDFMLQKIIDQVPITMDFILQVHKKLTKGTYDETRWSKGERPGTFKVHDYCVADEQGALPEEVPDEIMELCEELQDIPDRGDNILRAAAYLHCKFENIHPFADGNGRVGRTLMNYFLMSHNYPPLVVYNETKDQYYKALGHYDKTGDVLPFVDYMKESLEKTWEVKRAPENRLSDMLQDMKD